jgi:hypothetical protein
VFDPLKVRVELPERVRRPDPVIAPVTVEAAELVTVNPVSTLIAAPDSAPAVTARLLRELVDPTAPPKVTLPVPAETVSDCVFPAAPSTVTPELKVIAELVVVSVVSPES